MSASESAPALTRVFSRSAVAAVVFINAMLILFTSHKTLRHFPNSGDEYAYLLAAETFAEGRLSVPSPPERDFFFISHFINDGRFYGKYPPGWPAILAVGAKLGLGWLVNPVLGLLTFLVIYLLAKEQFSEKTAALALWCSLFSPYLIFNSASYFSHSSCLLFIALFTLFYLRSLTKPRDLRNSFFMGLSLGIAFIIRPYTAVAVSWPLLAWSSLRGAITGKIREWGPGALAFAAPASFCLLCFLGYNYLQTGDPFLTPFLKYAPIEKPMLFQSWAECSLALNQNLVSRFHILALWLPLSLLVLFASFWEIRKLTTAERCLLAMFCSLALHYFFYLPENGNQYGPRFYYEASFALIILGAALIQRCGKSKGLILAFVVAANAAALIEQTLYFAKQVRERMTIYDRVEARGITQAIVFLQSDLASMERVDLTRNGIHFDRPVLYVHDRGPEENARLLKAFPGKVAYYFHDGKLGKR